MLSATAPQGDLRNAQLARVRDLLVAVLPGNAFYAKKLAGVRPDDLRTLSDFARLPFTTKADLVADQAAKPALRHQSDVSGRAILAGCNLLQTSGTSSGQPLRWLDTAESWGVGARLLAGTTSPSWGCARATGCSSRSRSGRFLGFWSRLRRRGAVRIPEHPRRRDVQQRPAAVPARPPLHGSLRDPDLRPFTWRKSPRKRRIDTAGSTIRAVVVAGEPGGNISGHAGAGSRPPGRARVFDHYGMTEIGPVAVEAAERTGEMYLLECEYLAEKW